jgi:hypothetical protein
VLDIDLSGQNRHRMVQKLALHGGLQFPAVSYFSGSLSVTEVIFVDDHPLNVFKNLHTAISSTIGFWRRMPPDTPLYLWTDQVCIKQSNPSEKARQVILLRDIFTRAYQVFVSMPLLRDVGPGLLWALESGFTEDRGYTSPPNLVIDALAVFVERDA